MAPTMLSQICQHLDLQRCIRCSSARETLEAVKLHAIKLIVNPGRGTCNAVEQPCWAVQSVRAWACGGSCPVIAPVLSGVRGRSLQGAPDSPGLHLSREPPAPWPPPLVRIPSPCTSGTQTSTGPPPVSHSTASAHSAACTRPGPTAGGAVSSTSAWEERRQSWSGAHAARLPPRQATCRQLVLGRLCMNPVRNREGLHKVKK